MIDIRDLISTHGDLCKKTVNVACPRVLGSVELSDAIRMGTLKNPFPWLCHRQAHKGTKGRNENISVGVIEPDSCTSVC